MMSPAPSHSRGSSAATADSSLLTFGETMGLLVADQVGELGVVRSLGIGIGGSESNVAMSAARLGVAATWIGRVGPDAIGALIERRVRAAGVETVAIRDMSFSGIMLRHRPVGSLAHVDYHRAGSAGSHLCPPDIDEGRIRGAGILHVTGITPALSETSHGAVCHALTIARDAGVLISFDVNYRSKLWHATTARPVLRDLARAADIVFAGADEAQLVLGTPERDVLTLARGLAALGPTEVIIKDGDRGCLALVDGAQLDEPALRVAVVDSVGAGDAFVAGYLAERLAGAAPQDRLRTAAAMGAYAVGVPGDCDSLPTRSDLEALRALASKPDVLR